MAPLRACGNLAIRRIFRSRGAGRQAHLNRRQIAEKSLKKGLFDQIASHFWKVTIKSSFKVAHK
jgi:hypothetical protein